MDIYQKNMNQENVLGTDSRSNETQIVFVIDKFYCGFTDSRTFI